MKKILKTLLLFLFVIGYSSSIAQNTNMEDVVYLKNGSIIRGVIIEMVPNQTIKIQTKDKSVFVFKYDEIEKITKENITQNDSPKDNVEYKKSGFINITEITICPGVGEVEYNNNITLKNDDISFGFRTTNGYQLNEHLSLGIGVGVDKYKEATLLPITLDSRFSLLKGKVSPVFILNGGYAFGLNNSISGFTINPQLGLRAYVGKTTAYVFNIGYKLQEQKLEYIQFARIQSDNIYFGFLTLSTGLLF